MADQKSGPDRTSRPQRYHPFVQALHWVSALVIIWATITGFWAADAEPSAATAKIAAFNVALTTVFVPVFVLRIIVRTTTRDPEYLPVPRLEKRISLTAQIALYVTTLIVLLSGIFTVEKSTSIFGLFTLQPVSLSEASRTLVHDAHSTACMVLGLLMALHLGAVAFHSLKGRPILDRMLPQKSGNPAWQLLGIRSNLRIFSIKPKV